LVPSVFRPKASLRPFRRGPKGEGLRERASRPGKEEACLGFLLPSSEERKGEGTANAKRPKLYFSYEFSEPRKNS